MSKLDERRTIGQVLANSGLKVTKWWNGVSRLQKKNAAPPTCFDATRYHKKFSTRQRKTKHVMYATPSQKCSIGDSRICGNLVELNNPPASCIPDCFGVATISLAPVGVASTRYPIVMIHAQCPVKICKLQTHNPSKIAFRAFHYFAETRRNQDGVFFSFCHFGSNLLVPLFRIKGFGSAT